MINHKTLAKYLAKMFVKQFLVVSIIIICVLFVTNAFDILQKFRSANLTFSEFGMLVALKIPYLFCEVVHLNCLFYLIIVPLNNYRKVFVLFYNNLKKTTSYE